MTSAYNCCPHFPTELTRSYLWCHTYVHRLVPLLYNIRSPGAKSIAMTTEFCSKSSWICETQNSCSDTDISGSSCREVLGTLSDISFTGCLIIITLPFWVMAGWYFYTTRGWPKDECFDKTVKLQWIKSNLCPLNGIQLRKALEYNVTYAPCYIDINFLY